MDVDKLDLMDVRILAHSLFQVLVSESSGHQQKRKGLLTGKHLLVSLGQRGVLWCCSASQFPPDRRQQAGLVIDEVNNLCSWHLPAVTVDHKDIGTTNGAGDALLAGE